MVENAIFHDDRNGSIPSTFACKMIRGCKTMSKLANDSSTTSWMHLKHFKVDFEVRKIFIKNRFSVHYFYLKYSQFEREKNFTPPLQQSPETFQTFCICQNLGFSNPKQILKQLGPYPSRAFLNN